MPSEFGLVALKQETQSARPKPPHTDGLGIPPYVDLACRERVGQSTGPHQAPSYRNEGPDLFVVVGATTDQPDGDVAAFLEGNLVEAVGLLRTQLHRAK